jgi:hypothetical protein
MNPSRRLPTIAVLAALALASPIVATALAKQPSATTGAATVVSVSSAVVTGQVTPETKSTDYLFEYGTTTAYGQVTPVVELTGDHTPRTVSATIAGLAPGTTYHFRVKASNKDGLVTGADRTFTTAATTTPGATPAHNGGDAGGDGDAQQPTADVQPALGEAVVVAPAAGTVKVKVAGGAAFAELRSGDAIPVGSLVDTRAGTVKLTSSLADGGTQTGEFRGALFQIRQSEGGGGVTDLVLRGSDFASCRRSAALAAARRKPPVRRLWGHDDGGKFRTHGRNSVATVRGTSWVTTDTCAGTRTTVTEGAVSVRDLRRKRTVLVRAGSSYLARPAR